MIKTTTFSFLFVCMLIVTYAQEENIKFWNEGKLEWSDFQGKSTSGIQSSNLEQFLGYKIEKLKKQDTVFIYRKITGYMDKNLSWVHERAKNNQTLRYNQVLFNIGEYHRRLLQKKMFNEYFEFQAKEEFSNHVSISGDMIGRYIQETNHGRNLDKLLLWEENTDTLLKTHPGNDIPAITQKEFGFAYHYAIGGALHTGTFKTHFSHRMAISFGVDLTWKKSLLALNYYLDGITTEHRYENELVWEKNDRNALYLMDLALGYSPIDARKIKITPLIGFGVALLNEPYKKEDKVQETLESFGLTYGLRFDYKIRKKYRLIANAIEGRIAFIETDLQFQLNFTKLDFAPDLRGNLINFSVGIGSLTKRLTLSD